jgi:hypothetical protein
MLLLEDVKIRSLTSTHSEILTRVAFLQACWMKDLYGFPSQEACVLFYQVIFAHALTFYNNSDKIKWSNPSTGQVTLSDNGHTSNICVAGDGKEPP